MFSEGEICMDTGRTMVEDDWRLLSSQLQSPTYDFRGTRILVESKKDIKARLGQSPDRADCAVMGWFKYPHIASLGMGKKQSMPRWKKRSAMAS